ncbi:MAG: DUF1150 family protein [Paracoccaceae bacterium]
MDKQYEMPDDASRIVYVKSIDVADLPADVRREAGGLERLYAVHRDNGEQLALVANRKLAFSLARENNFAPVPVH